MENTIRPFVVGRNYAEFPIMLSSARKINDVSRELPTAA